MSRKNYPTVRAPEPTMSYRARAAPYQFKTDVIEDFACRNRLPSPTHFTDDGISGTRFGSGFLAMMEEVEAGACRGLIVIKDMSRLGRDYLKSVKAGGLAARRSSDCHQRRCGTA